MQHHLPSFSGPLVVITVVALAVGTLVLPGNGGPLQAIFRSQHDDGRILQALPDMRPEVQAHRSVWREQRREYGIARERCRDLRHQGQPVDCTTITINDPSTFRPFLEGGAIATDAVPEPTHTAAPASVRDTSLEQTVNALTERDRRVLHRYQRLGTCPITLAQYLPGFYELCQQVVTEFGSALRQRTDRQAQRKIPKMAVPQKVTANDVAEANKRPIPQQRPSIVPRHEFTRSSSAEAE